MVAVITGDIINSRYIEDQEVWLEPIKRIFNEWGEAPKIWEIYRGDSFQIEISQPENALIEAIKIKSGLKSSGKNIDVRMGIGIGEKIYDAPKVTESNGPGFINAGDAFERTVKYKKSIAIITPWEEFNNEIKVMMDFALLMMDKWTVTTAKVIKASMENPEMKQSEIAEMRGLKSQPGISQARKRGAYEEIMEMEAFFKNSVTKYMNLQ